MKSKLYVFLSTALLLGVTLAFPQQAEAYVGPGAGFAFVSSFLIILSAFLLAFLTLLTWPIRWLFRLVRARKLVASRTKKIVVLGLDGQDPVLTEEMMSRGLLPNFQRLKERGCYRRLETTLPAESPVAWSSFQTGCNPGRHRVFDFLVPDRKSYLPKLCSASIEPPSRHLRLGKYKIPLGKPRVLFERKSESFWSILGKHGIFSSVLRVPISFPPEKFHGTLLSAMSVPDLKGTQGTFSYYSSDPGEREKYTGGIQVPVDVENGVVRSSIEGPVNPIRADQAELRLPFKVSPGKNGEAAILAIGGKKWPLKLNEFTPWIPLSFSAGLGVKVRGICRFFLKEMSPHFKLYVSPINIDPAKPALPVSHPFTYSMYLSKTQGSFSTLGLAEDTWALNEGVLDEEAFLKQAYLIHEERERMFFDAIDKTSSGAVVCVFDITDRLQHMFWRYLEDGHPANQGKDVEVHRKEIEKLYRKMDDLVGRTLDVIDDDTVLMVMSDHGFKSFRRGVNLNSWLHQNGYLAVKKEPTGREWFEDVDWSKTRAFAVGLGGVYLNVAGRESSGIVQPSEIQSLKAELIEGLGKLRDSNDGVSPINRVYDTQENYKGPYVAEAPDLIVGFKPGYRASWTSVTGAVSPEIFEDNTKAWSGDHCLNPPDVPGILFCNKEIAKSSPSIMDIAPTVLDLFGVPVPAYCDGESLMPAKPVVSPVPAPGSALERDEARVRT